MRRDRPGVRRARPKPENDCVPKDQTLYRAHGMPVMIEGSTFGGLSVGMSPVASIDICIGVLMSYSSGRIRCEVPQWSVRV